MVLHLLVEGHFRLGNFGRKQIQSQDAIPNHVVFLAPRSRTIKRQPQMIPVVGFFHQPDGIFPGQLEILIRFRVVTAQFAQLREGTEAADRFNA